MFQFSTTFASCRPAWGQTTTPKGAGSGRRNAAEVATCKAHTETETKRLRDSVNVSVSVSVRASAEHCVCKRHQHNFHHSAINTKYADERRRTVRSDATRRVGGVCAAERRAESSRTCQRVVVRVWDSQGARGGVTIAHASKHWPRRLRERAMRARESEPNETNEQHEPDKHTNELTNAKRARSELKPVPSPNSVAEWVSLLAEYARFAAQKRQRRRRRKRLVETRRTMNAIVSGCRWPLSLLLLLPLPPTPRPAPLVRQP